MKINSNEVESIEEAGELGQSPVRMIRTKGGFWVAVGRPKGKAHEQALAAGSHPAIVKYNLEQAYPDYHPGLQKSESMIPEAKVMQHSHFLSEDLRKAGYDLHSVEGATTLDFVITQHGTTKTTLKGIVKGEDLEFTAIEGSAPGTAADALTKAISEKALNSKFARIRFK